MLQKSLLQRGRWLTSLRCWSAIQCVIIPHYSCQDSSHHSKVPAAFIRPACSEVAWHTVVQCGLPAITTCQAEGEVIHFATRVEHVVGTPAGRHRVMTGANK